MCVDVLEAIVIHAHAHTHTHAHAHRHAHAHTHMHMHIHGEPLIGLLAVALVGIVAAFNTLADALSVFASSTTTVTENLLVNC